MQYLRYNEVLQSPIYIVFRVNGAQFFVLVYCGLSRINPISRRTRMTTIKLSARRGMTGPRAVVSADINCLASERPSDTLHVSTAGDRLDS